MIKLKVNACDGIYDSLDVRFTKACDNRCSFCIEKEGLQSLGNTDVDKLIKSTLESNKKDILILGGEPLLTPELVLKYIKGIRESVDTIYLTTSLPKSVISGDDNFAFKKIIKLLDGINISIHHHLDEINNSVLDSTNPYNRIEFLDKMLKWDEFAKKARICCNLVSGYIDSKESIDSFVSYMSLIGVRHIKLNELQNVDADTYISFEDVYKIKMKSPFAHGCQTDVSDIFKQFNMKITLKRSCFCNKDISISKATLGDLLKCVYKRINTKSSGSNLKVLYENGDIYDSWQTDFNNQEGGLLNEKSNS